MQPTLDQLRRSADLTVREVSRRTGVEYNALWRLMRAQSHVSPSELARVEGFLIGAARERTP
jgi:hypothetical protein